LVVKQDKVFIKKKEKNSDFRFRHFRIQLKKKLLCYFRITKTIDKPINRFKVLAKGKDKAGEFYKSFAGMFAYVSNRISEIR
jgi:hypothetical protein